MSIQEREKWLSSIQDKYLGEIIAFAKIDGEWKVLAHGVTEEELFAKEIDENIFLKFRRFGF